jgi:hypothetical protein
MNAPAPAERDEQAVAGACVLEAALEGVVGGYADDDRGIAEQYR